MLGFTQKQLGFALFTFIVYALLVGWQVALLLIIAVGFHEYCHLWAAKKMGLNTKGFYLVPFMGGVALVDGRYKSYGQQAFVVLAGPIGGGLLAIATAIAYHFTGIPFLAAAGTWMLYLNLFNLLPLSFMDGGQLMGTLTYSINRTLGMVCNVLSTIVAAYVMWHFNPVLLFLVLFLGGSAVLKEILDWNNFRKGKQYLCADTYLNPPEKLSVVQWIATAGTWAVTFLVFGLILAFLRQMPEANFNTLFQR